MVVRVGSRRRWWNCAKTVEDTVVAGIWGTMLDKGRL